MDRKEMVARLAGLRQAVEQEAEVSLSALQTTFALALWDVCRALGLMEEERSEVMGQEACACIHRMLDAPVWALEKPMVAAV